MDSTRTPGKVLNALCKEDGLNTGGIAHAVGSNCIVLHNPPALQKAELWGNRPAIDSALMYVILHLSFGLCHGLAYPKNHAEQTTIPHSMAMKWTV